MVGLFLEIWGSETRPSACIADKLPLSDIPCEQLLADNQSSTSYIFKCFVTLKLHMARNCGNVKFDNATAKAVVSVHFIEYNIVPELIQMWRDVLLHLDCIWSPHNSHVEALHYRMLKQCCF